jgi:hypothetical protein
MLVYFNAILSMFRPFGIFYGIWYNFPRFGIFSPFGRLRQEKSGNPGIEAFLSRWSVWREKARVFRGKSSCNHSHYIEKKVAPHCGLTEAVTS